MELWEELKADAEKGARRLVDECGGRLLTAALHITQNAADAEDIVFRTLSQVVSNIGKYDGRSAFFSWIYAIMLNFRRMDLRRRAANMLDFTDELPETADVRPDPAEAFFWVLPLKMSVRRSGRCRRPCAFLWFCTTTRITEFRKSRP